MKREVSCKVIEALLQYMEERQMDISPVYRDNPYSLDHLRDTNERIEWDVFRRVLQNLRQTWSDADFEAVGHDITRHTSFKPLLALGRLLFDGPEIYRWWGKSENGFGVQMISCVQPEVIQLEEDRMLVTLTLLPGHAHCREFFIITKGCFAAGTTVFGLPEANVRLEEFERGARYDIIFPRVQNGFSWIRHARSWFPSVRSIAFNLQAANTSLHERYKELEDARDKLSRQATQLKVAYDISQLIRADLDLDATLDAIARSLVEVAGFAAAMVTMDATLSGQRMVRRAEAGHGAGGGVTMTRILEARGRQIGSVSLTLADHTDPAGAEELLEYVVPTITTEIDEALSFTAVDELRATLEAKVGDRTRELEETNAALKRAQAGRDRLFANISHELRTPLTLILGPLETMREQSRAGPERQRLTLMKRSADRLLGLINQMLELARLQSGDLVLHATPSAVIPFLRGITMSYRSLAATRHIDLAFHAVGECVKVELDPDKAEMLFNNLLINAFKFTPDGGRIDVHVRTEGTDTVISVTDTGVGIPETEIAHIFDRFYQGTSRTGHPTGGTGIGLALAREIVELHHGSLRVASREGTGSTFTVTLPLLAEDRTPERTASSHEYLYADDRLLSIHAEPVPTLREAAGRKARKHQVLIVDDDPDVRQYLREILGDEAGIAEAGDGDEGITRAQELVPDLIICDVMMPKRDGNEVCRVLKEDVRTSHIPVILLTARAGTESRIEGLETGADDFLVKPFIAREVRARVRNLIAGREALHQRFTAEHRLTPAVLRLPSREQTFLERVIQCIDTHLADEGYTIQDLSKESGLSRAQLHRKLVSLTGCSARDLLRRIRLERAYDLLLANAGTIAEIAYQVGFADPSHFSRCFRQQYGFAPGSARKHVTEHPRIF